MIYQLQKNVKTKPYLQDLVDNHLREYDWKDGRRKHRNNGQGQAMVRRVKEVGLYNFFYKAGEKRVPAMEREVRLVWDKYTAKFNRRWG